MDLRQLEIFVKVAELGSFSRAAQALFLTQPTVSDGDVARWAINIPATPLLIVP